MINALWDGICKTTRKCWVWVRRRFPPLKTKFDKSMAWVACAIFILTIALAYILQARCVDALAIMNVVGLCILAFSIPVSLIRGRSNWQWPIALAIVAAFLWCMSTALGPSGTSEIPRFFAELLNAKCKS